MTTTPPTLAKLKPNQNWAKLPLFNRKNWSRVRFDDVVENLNETCEPAEAGLERVIAMEHLEPGSLHIRSWGNVADGTTFTRRCRPGQVLFGKRRAYQRKVAVAEFDAVVSGDIYVLAPKGDRLLPELLPFLCLSERFFQHAVGTSAGSLSPRTNWSSLASFEFDLPPLDQQRRIAEILWAADKHKELLLATHFSFQNYHAALANERLVGAAGTRTKLSALSHRGELDLQTGPFGTVLQASSYVKSGTPIVNPVNMRKHRLFVDDGPFLDKKECERLTRYKLFIGDIILGRKGDVGRAVFITPEYEGWIAGSDIIRVRLINSKLRSDFLYYFLLAPVTRAWVARHASGTTMPGINEKLINNIELPIPTPAKQLELVREFEQLNQVDDTLLDAISAGANLILSLANQLTDSH